MSPGRSWSISWRCVSVTTPVLELTDREKTTEASVADAGAVPDVEPTITPLRSYRKIVLPSLVRVESVPSTPSRLRP